MANNHSEIEKRLWASADELRANSKLKASEYSVPVLGLIFLRYADFKFAIAEKELAGKGSGRRAIGKEDYQAKGVMYLPPQARFSKLLDLPEGQNIGKAINEAMKAVEAENREVGLESVVLPKNYNKIENSTLISLLKTFSQIPMDVEGDMFGKIYEYFLGNFARAEGAKGGEIHAAKEVATLLIELVKPRSGMSIYDPCVGTGNTLLEARRHVTRTDEGGKLRLFGQEIAPETLALCKMNLLVNGVFDADIRLGNTLTAPQHAAHGKLMEFDRVIANPPFAVPQLHGGELENEPYCRFRYGIPPKSFSDFAFIQHMIASVAPEGAMAVVVPHGVLFRGGSEGRIRQGILEDDLIEAVIGLPPGLFYGTRISAAVLVIKKHKSAERIGKVLFINANREFVQEDRQNRLRHEDLSRIITTLDSYSDSERYSKVVSLDEIRSNSFNLNIPRYADSSPLAGLVTQYSQFAKRTIRELAVEVNSVSGKGRFEDKANAVYVPMMGNKRPTDSLSDLESNHNAFYQVVLNEQAINAYVAQFLGTSVGQHAISVLVQGTVVKRLSKADLQECMIALPSLDNQREIVCTHQKLAALKDAISNIDRELSLNPTGQTEFRKKVDSLLTVLGALSDADYVRSIIRQGESKTVEFKETYSLDVRKGTKEQYIETSALKTLVAFFNSDGGILLIGVNDTEKIVGVNVELKKFHKDTLDNFLKHFKNSLKSRIGEAFYPFLNYRILDVESSKVLVVECEPSKSPCFLDGNEFYVRTNPATDKLEGPKFLEYVKHRFEK